MNAVLCSEATYSQEVNSDSNPGPHELSAWSHGRFLRTCILRNNSFTATRDNNRLLQTTSHQDLRCLTFSLSTLQKNFQIDSLLTLCTLGKFFSRHFETFSLFSKETGFDISCKL